MQGYDGACDEEEIIEYLSSFADLNFPVKESVLEEATRFVEEEMLNFEIRDDCWNSEINRLEERLGKINWDKVFQISNDSYGLALIMK